jgi:site-specific DNA recombinase
MTTNRNPGTATYLRISEDRLGLELGVDRQREDCLELCQRRGWAAPVEYADNDLSATTGKHRPGYAALVDAVKAGRIGRVVVWHNSRLWRNRRERADGIELFKAHAVTLAAVKGPELDMSTAYGRGLAGLIGEFDSLESEVKSERVKAAVKQRASTGKRHGGPRLYGYTVDGTALVPAEAKVMTAAFAKVAAGRSLSAVARDAAMLPSTLRTRLLRPAYAGLIVYEGREYPAAGPAVVDVEVWRTVKATIEGRRRFNGGAGIGRKHLGSGLYRCECGMAVRYSLRRSTRDKLCHGTYQCRPDPYRAGCWRTWKQDPIDAFVIAAVRERLGRADLADLLPVDRPDLEALRGEAAGIRARIKRLRSDFVLLGADDETELAETIEAGKHRLVAIEADLADAGRGAGVLGELVACEDPVALFDAIPVDQVDRRQAVIRAVLSIRLLAPPRGRLPAGTDPVVFYGERCVVLGPPAI